MLAVGRCGGLGADEEERVERVEDGVERANHESVCRRHLLLHDCGAVDVLLEHAAYRHAKDDRAVRAQTQQTVERRVGDEGWALRQHLASDFLDRIAAISLCEDAILQEWVEGTRADEAGGAESAGLLDAALDEVLAARRRVV